MGLSPLLVQEIFRIIRDVNEDGTTVLLVEQNAQLALSVADRGYVLETGKVIMSGGAKTLLVDEQLRPLIWAVKHESNPISQRNSSAVLAVPTTRGCGVGSGGCDSGARSQGTSVAETTPNI